MHRGRVDPRALDWGFSIAGKKLDRAALRARLRILGDLTEDAPDAAPDGTPIYDAGAVAAVKRF